MPASLYLGLLAPLLVITGLLAGCCIRGAAWICRARNALWRRALIGGVLLQAVGVPFYFAMDSARSKPGPLLIGVFALGLFVLAMAFFAAKWAARAAWGRSLAVFGVYILLNGAMAIGVSMVLKRTIYDTYHISTNSMAPTLGANDRFMADRTMSPRRWDIAVFRSPSGPGEVYMKRIVGLPGETVELRAGEVFINGQLVPKPASLASLSYDNTARGFPGFPPMCRGGEGSPMTLGPDEYYVLGDNTRESNDSRYWTEPAVTGQQPGAVPRDMIIGTARVIYSPPSRRRLLR